MNKQLLSPLVPLFLLLLASYFCAAIAEPSFFFDLTIARWIIATKSLPHEDLWTIAGAGLRWADSSWLYHMLLGIIDQLLPQSVFEHFFLCFKLALFVVSVVSFFFCFSKLANDYFLGALLTTISAAIALPQTEIGARLLSYPLFILVLFLALENLRQERSPIGALLLSLLFLFQLHQVAFLAWIIVLFLFFAKQGRWFPEKLLRLVLLLIIPLFSPYFGLYLFQVSRQLVSELSLALLLREESSSIFHTSFALTVIVVFFFSMLWHRRPQVLTKAEQLLAVLAILGSFLNLQLLPYLGIILCLLCARLWAAEDAKGLGNFAQGLEKLRALLARVPLLGTAWLILCFIFVNVYKLYQSPFNELVFPTREIDYFYEAKLPRPMFQQSWIGDYFTYRFADPTTAEPRERAFSNSQSAGINPTLLQREFLLRKVRPLGEALLNEMGVQTILVLSVEPLFEILRRDSGWQLVFLAGKPYVQAEQTAAEFPIGWALFVRRAAAPTMP